MVVLVVLTALYFSVQHHCLWSGSATLCIQQHLIQVQDNSGILHQSHGVSIRQTLLQLCFLLFFWFLLFRISSPILCVCFRFRFCRTKQTRVTLADQVLIYGKCSVKAQLNSIKRMPLSRLGTPSTAGMLGNKWYRQSEWPVKVYSTFNYLCLTNCCYSITASPVLFSVICLCSRFKGMKEQRNLFCFLYPVYHHDYIRVNSRTWVMHTLNK